MVFNTEIHTKEYLLKNVTDAFSLAYTSKEFSNSDLVKDRDILKIRNSENLSIAHVLASFERLDLSSEIATSLEILKMQDHTGWSVAHSIVEASDEFLVVDNVFNKDVLACEYDGWILAEYICDIYGGFYNLELPDIAIKMIRQGAAYKHSTLIGIEDGLNLISKFEEIKNELNPEVTLKQIQAFYSTCVHNKAKLDDSSEPEVINFWNETTLDAQEALAIYYSHYPQFLEMENVVNFGCEPADDFLKKIQNEKVWNDFCIESSPTNEETMSNTIY